MTPWDDATIGKYIEECFVRVVDRSESKAISSKMTEIHGLIYQLRYRNGEFVQNQRYQENKPHDVQRDQQSATFMVLKKKNISSVIAPL